MPLIVILLLCVLGGGVTVTATLVVAIAVVSGKIALPGSTSHALKAEKQQLQIARIRKDKAELDFERSQHVANRLIMDAKANIELERIQHEGYQLALERGKETGDVSLPR